MSNLELREIRSEIGALGYLPIPNGPRMKKQDLWYKRSDNSKQIDSFLFLAYKPEAQAYSVHAGIVSRNARSRVLAALGGMKEFINPLYLADTFYIGRPCWHMFDAGRALGWSSVYVIPDPYDRSQWRARFDELVHDFLAKRILGISGERDIIDLLLRNDAPFEWSLTNPVLRVAEVVSMARNCGVSVDDLMLKLVPLKKDIERGLYGPTGYDVVMAIIVKLLY